MRSAHDAVKAAKAHAETGHDYVVDMDITKFFDRVNHDILMSKIGKVVRDKRVLQIVGRFLRAGVVMPDGLAVSSEEGTPQGGPLSPLLANIYLDELDKELERRGLKFARYADDCNIYVSSEKAAKRAKENITAWLKRKLRLEVNESKSGIGRPWERKFLGFTFTAALLITIASSSLGKFKEQVRELWEARQSKSSVELRDQWKSYVQGWWGYYRLSEWRRPIFDTEGWIRRRIRCCFWQRWHSSAGRQAALRRMGVPAERAKVGSSSKGAWAMASHVVMNEALSNKTLKKWKFVMPSQLGK